MQMNQRHDLGVFRATAVMFKNVQHLPEKWSKTAEFNLKGLFQADVCEVSVS